MADFSSKNNCIARTYSYTLPTIAFANHKEPESLQEFRVTTKKLVMVRQTLKMFIGMHNFHNFTSGRAYIDPSSRRFIHAFVCNDPFVVNGVEFVVIVVKGQSFMLRQIRKMIGLMLAVVRKVTTTGTISHSFKQKKIDMPIAPGLGLVLDRLHYDGYNKRVAGDSVYDMLIWDELDKKILQFRDNFINPVIINTEINEQPMLKWLETLQFHSYDGRTNQTKGIDKNLKVDGNEDEEAEELGSDYVDDSDDLGSDDENFAMELLQRQIG